MEQIENSPGDPVESSQRQSKSFISSILPGLELLKTLRSKLKMAQYLYEIPDRDVTCQDLNVALDLSPSEMSDPAITSSSQQPLASSSSNFVIENDDIEAEGPLSTDLDDANVAFDQEIAYVENSSYLSDLKIVPRQQLQKQRQQLMENGGRDWFVLFERLKQLCPEEHIDHISGFYHFGYEVT